MIAVLVLLLFLALPAQAESDLASRPPDQFICGTSPDRTKQMLAQARFNRQRQTSLLSSAVEAVTVDFGNVAVLEDDGTVITQPNPLDLANRSITFTPAAGGRYSVISEASALDAGAGGATTLSLADDDATAVSLPFSFPFYGVSYASVFLNSDGNLTFTARDDASTARSLSRIAAGVPRIFPLFADLNPIAPGRISVETLSDRVLLTWTGVGEWVSGGNSRGQNTFQAVLYANGVIRFNYGRLEATAAVVGIAPGRSANAENSLVDMSAQSTPNTLVGLIAEVFALRQEVDLSQVARIFYRTHPDAYDGLIVFSDFSLDLDGAFAFANPVRNSVRGIMTDARSGIYDFGAAFGSTGRLSVAVNMGDIARYPANPRQQFMRTYSGLSVLAHEFGHRWLSYIDTESPSLLDNDRAHWSFLHNAFGSVMEGNQIEDLGNDRFRTVAATFRYSPLDQYLMGLRSASEVPPWFAITSPGILAPVPSGFPAECRNISELPGCRPHVGVQLSGIRRDITIDEMIATAGLRAPGVEEAQKDFRVAFILVTRRGQTPRSGSLGILEPLIAQWPPFFSEAVEGRGTVSTDLQYLPPANVEVRAEIPSHGSRRVETTGVDSSTRVGYATLDAALGISVVRFMSGSDIRSEAAVPAATIGDTFRVYAERTATSSTGLALLNPGETAAEITAQLNDGRQTTLHLPAHTQRSLFIHELFPSLAAPYSGTLLLRSPVPIGLVGLRGTLNERNEFIMTTVPVSSESTTNGILVFPQIADGGEYVTELILMNHGDTAASGSIEFSFDVATDRGTNHTFSYDILPGGAWKLLTSGTRPDVQVVFAEIIPGADQITPRATAVLKRRSGTNLSFEAGVPATESFTEGLMFGVRNSTHRSVVALVNRGTGPTLVTLTAYRTSGVAQSSRTVSLEPNQHVPRFLDELLPDLPGDYEGTVTITASTPIHAVTLRTLVNQSGAFLMTAMPIINLGAPVFSSGFFPQLVDGGNFSTEFLLLNTNATTAHLQFFSLDGQPMAVPLR